jgi:hypothetical protein
MSTPNITNRLYLETLLRQMEVALDVINKEYSALTVAYHNQSAMVMTLIESMHEQLKTDDSRKK